MTYLAALKRCEEKMEHYYRIETAHPIERSDVEEAFKREVVGSRIGGRRDILDLVDGSLLLMTSSQDGRVYLELKYTFNEGLELINKFFSFCIENDLAPRSHRSRSAIRNGGDLFSDYKWSKAFRMRLG